MPTRNPESLVERLRETNARLEYWLDSLPAATIPEPGRPSVISPQQMAALLSELMRVGQWLRELPQDRDTSLQQQLDEYRCKVERLRDLMPSMHAALLRERNRLDQERGRIESAAEWARRSRQTL